MMEESSNLLFVASCSFWRDAFELQMRLSGHRLSNRLEAASAKFHLLKVHIDTKTALLAAFKAMTRRSGRFRRLLLDVPFVNA